MSVSIRLVLLPQLFSLLLRHETTLGLLSFIFNYLLKNCLAYVAAHNEIDDVFGERHFQVADLKILKHLDTFLREVIRLSPTTLAMSKQIHSQLDQ